MQKKTAWIAGSAIGLALILGGAGVGWAVSNSSNSDDSLSSSALEQASAVALAAVGEGTVSNAELSDDLDHAYAIEVTIADGSEVDVLLDEAFAVVRIENDSRPTPQSSASASTSTEPSSAPSSSATPETGTTPGNFDNLTEEEMASASAAALEAVGSGTVFDIERSDDRDHAYEVTIILANGEDVDVELDAQFKVTKVDR
jgi:uncharacterized membrane protein YkoI